MKDVTTFNENEERDKEEAAGESKKKSIAELSLGGIRAQLSLLQLNLFAYSYAKVDTDIEFPQERLTDIYDYLNSIIPLLTELISIKDFIEISKELADALRASLKFLPENDETRINLNKSIDKHLAQADEFLNIL